MIQAFVNKPSVKPQAPPGGRLVLTPVLLGRQAAAKVLGVSLSTLDGLVADGGLPSVRVGGRRMLRPSDLEAWAARLPAAPARESAQKPEIDN